MKNTPKKAQPTKPARGDERNPIAKVPYLVAGMKRAAPLIADINRRAADIRRSEPQPRRTS